jgi:nucleotidyltransferase/DNA polymerase involved in DNA repair
MKAKQDIYVIVEYDDVADYLQEAIHEFYGVGRRHKKV